MSRGSMSVRPALGEKVLDQEHWTGPTGQWLHQHLREETNSELLLYKIWDIGKFMHVLVISTY